MSMSLIPEDEIKHQGAMNLAPIGRLLISCPFALFATLTITWTALFDTEESLVKLTPRKKGESPPSTYHPTYIVNWGVTDKGQYK